MKKVSIITLGCKVNQVESENIAEYLEKIGFDVKMGIETADIYIINTCAVTNEAERKSRNIITKVLKLNNSADIYVCGCSSENNAENFTKHENVKGVIGTKDKIELAKMIENNEQDYLSKNKTNYSCDDEIRVNERTRAVLWVQSRQTLELIWNIR